MRLLFVCSKNRWRSPTAERIFDNVAGTETASAGVSPDAENPLTADLIAWADVVFVMEPIHRTKMQRHFGRELHGKKIVCLGVPDRFQYMSPELIDLLWDKVPHSVPALRGMRGKGAEDQTSPD